MSQSDINKQILAQLESLGDRINCLEQNWVKKTSDKSKIKSSKKTSKASATGRGFGTE